MLKQATGSVINAMAASVEPTEVSSGLGEKWADT